MPCKPGAGRFAASPCGAPAAAVLRELRAEPQQHGAPLQGQTGAPEVQQRRLPARAQLRRRRKWAERAPVPVVQQQLVREPPSVQTKLPQQAPAEREQRQGAPRAWERRRPAFPGCGPVPHEEARPQEVSPLLPAGARSPDAQQRRPGPWLQLVPPEAATRWQAPAEAQRWAAPGAGQAQFFAARDAEARQVQPAWRPAELAREVEEF